jgi:uncharacterized protein
MKRYTDLSTHLKDVFDTKVVKLSLNGGFGCPNREKGSGCLFCSETGAGDFAGDRASSISEQLGSQKQLLSKKWKAGAYIAYFGSFTSTSAEPLKLKKLYDESLACKGVVGLAIATRPDCLSKEILSLLEYYNKKTFLWIELGLQSAYTKTHMLLHTGYTPRIFDDAMSSLKARAIRTVPHLIFGLPRETGDMILKSVGHIASQRPWGLKIHMLYILKDSPLYDLYINDPFHILTLDEYSDLVVDALELLPDNVVIHRLTGDPPKEKAFMPMWSINKKIVLQTIAKKMDERNSFQGKYFCDTI